MRVNLYATFRHLAGVKSLELDFPAGATLRQVISEILARYPALRPHWLNPDGELQPHVLIFAHGKNLTLLPDCLETPIPAGETLEFFPPISGGTNTNCI